MGAGWWNQKKDSTKKSIRMATETDKAFNTEPNEEGENKFKNFENINIQDEEPSEKEESKIAGKLFIIICSKFLNIFDIMNKS